MNLENAESVNRGKITRTFGEVTISSEFDSGNLDRAERLEQGDFEYEFSLWTAPDCAGTYFQNGNRSWFYFKVITPANFEGRTLRFNVMNMNRQTRLYKQGLTPMFRSFPGRGCWERLRGIVQYEMENGQMTLQFNYTVHDSNKRTTYFAFCYPFSYTECQNMLEKLDTRFSEPSSDKLTDSNKIYYHRELICRSLEGRRVDLVTVSSHHSITGEEEPRLDDLFPDRSVNRARRFKEKKVFFLSSRVHPGETPSSFVFNGFLNFILRPDDPRAVVLRKNFVFKLIPMLNPDGVARGHYRMDTRGNNLNRFYLSPDRGLHPSIHAARSLFLHHHNKGSAGKVPSTCLSVGCVDDTMSESQSSSDSDVKQQAPVDCQEETAKSGIAFYVDLHGHASKRGCFMYGNYFKSEANQVETMLLPKLISLNSAHFDFDGCLFSEKNMYAADKNGTSKEGSGRVALHKASGHLYCYTLECNYNSGCMVNSIAGATTDGGRATPPQEGSYIPHKYTIEDYEEVGRGLAVAVLDIYQINPWSRLPKTEYGSLANVRHTLLHQVTTSRSKGTTKSSNIGAKHVTKSDNVSDTEDYPVPTTRTKFVVDTNPTRSLARLRSSKTPAPHGDSTVRRGAGCGLAILGHRSGNSMLSGSAFTASQLLKKKESKKSSVKSAFSKASSTPNPQQQKCREVGKVALKPSLANMGSITRMRLSSKANSTGRNTVKAVSSGKKSRIPRRVEHMKMKLQLSSSYSDPEPLERKGTLQTLSTQPGPLADPSTGKHHNADVPGSKSDEMESSVSSLHFLSQLELKKNMSPPNLPKGKLLRRQKHSIHDQISNCFLLMDWKRDSKTCAEKLATFDTFVNSSTQVCSRTDLRHSF